jgi:hypothetical protein
VDRPDCLAGGVMSFLLMHTSGTIKYWNSTRHE